MGAKILLQYKVLNTQTHTERDTYRHTHTHPNPVPLHFFSQVRKRITCPQRLRDAGREVGPRLGSPAAEVREQTQMEAVRSSSSQLSVWGIAKTLKFLSGFFFSFPFTSLKG